MRNLTLSLGWLILSSTCLAQTMDWVQVKPKTSPGIRWGHGTSHDFVRARTVIFGGGPGNTFGNETWEYDGTNWTQMKPKTVPPGRRITAMAFHFARVKTVMFGGGDSAGQRNDTWTWDGKDWTQMNPKNSPSVRWAHSMAYDSARQRTVLFGGLPRNNETWEWDGVNWTQIKTKNAPSPRYAPIAYDSARKRIVLFSGADRTLDTWEYDGKDWTLMKPKAQPTARCCYSMEYDPGRKRIVIFGGSPYTNDTWEYDGITWTQIKTKNAPSPRRAWDGMVYDVRRKRMVYFGGINTSGRLNETWEYGATETLAGSPSTISIATGGTQTFSLNAGTANASRLHWVFGSVTGTSPGVTLTSAVGSVNIPLNPDFYTDITIALANTALLTKTRGTLSASGSATASLNVPKGLPSTAIGVKLYHAYLVYDAKSNFYMASNPVELTLVK